MISFSFGSVTGGAGAAPAFVARTPANHPTNTPAHSFRMIRSSSRLPLAALHY
jgi:hypothetical protein